MKKKNILLFIVSVSVICVLCFSLASCGGESKTYSVQPSGLTPTSGWTTDALTEEICDSYPDRTSGTGNDLAFLSDYVNLKMRAFGYPALSDAEGSEAYLSSYRFTDTYDQQRLKDGYNALWRKSASGESKGTIWLVAAYDNSAGINVTNMDLNTGTATSGLLGGEGAYGSATSVAVLLALADRLYGAELSYDVIFLFTGCSQFANEGILDALADESAPSLVVNFNRLGGGDANYIYSAEVRTDFNDAFYSAAEAVGGDTFRRIPSDKNIVRAQLYEDQPNDYTHIGMYGDNMFTMSRGIPTVSFLSLAWESDENPFYTEISGADNVYNTSADTYDNMIERLGGGETGVARLRAVLDGVVETVAAMLSPANADVLDEVMTTAAEQAATGNIGSHADAGTYTRLAIVLVVVAAAVTVSVAIRNKLVAKQQKKMEEVRRQASGQAGPAPREDIFEGYGDGEDDDKKNDDIKKDPPDDDIFEM